MPLASTRAFVRSLVAYVVPVAPAMAALRASRAVAVSGIVVPMPAAFVAGVSESDTNFCATSTLTVAETEPLVAVMTADPLPTDVMVAVD